MYNGGLPHLYTSADTIQVTRSRKMRWVGHWHQGGEGGAGGIMDTRVE